MHSCCAVLGRGGWPNAIVWCMCMNVCCVLLCVCMFLNACVCLCVTDQKGAKIQYIINWVPFVLPLYMMSYTTESERSLPWPRVHEPWKADTSNPGDGSGESVMSHRTEARLVPVNLSGRPDTSATQRLAASVALHFQAPTLFFLSSCPPPTASRWIFSHSLTLKALLTAPATASERASRVRKMCVLYVWCGFSSSGLRQPQCTRQPMWTDAQKGIMHADEGGGGCRGTGLRLES